MDRRLIVLVGLTLAVVGYGFQFALAQSPSSSLLPSSPASGPRASGTREVPAPAELPAANEPGFPPKGPNPSGAAPELPAEMPPASLPPAGALPAPPEPPAGMPPGHPSDAPRDLEIEKSQVPVLGTRSSAPAAAASKGKGPDHGPLPPANESPGHAGAGPSESAGREADPFVLPPDRLQLGRQAVSLTIDVVAPQVLNLNQVATLKIVVRNTGTSDAMGVVVRDELPESLSFLASQPEAEQSEPLLFWRLNTVPAGAERQILVRVKPIKVGPFDHAATVTMLAGGKSRTIVREPKLKVEQEASTGNVLKGQSVHFKITISNPGTGPARNVVVQAKLSPGLKHSDEPNDQNLFEQTLDQIEPGQRVVLDTLVADTIQAGEQSCQVVAQSSDVTTSADDARSVATVTVVEPKLKMTLSGDDKRLTGMIATYNVTLENPGTATVHGARVLVTLPLSGHLILPAPPDARWDPSSGKLLWTKSQIEPGEKEKVTLTFQVRMGGVELYQVAAVARADGGLSASANWKTEVQGMADFEMEILERRRVIDVADTTAFQIRIKNVGTKEATQILVSALLSKNIDPLETTNGTDDRSQAQWSAEKQTLVFPAIERLSPGKDVILKIKVKAKEEGLATCHIFLLHDELKDPAQALQDMSHFRITAPRR